MPLTVIWFNVHPMRTPLVIDVGMFDAADTEYYLETGHRVLAIEAHPAYARSAAQRLQSHITAGQLSILNVAISDTDGPVTLNLSASNAGGHSVLTPTESAGASVTVPGRRMRDILADAGERPKLVKIDIEGLDGVCLRDLTPENRPDYVSCEVHDGLAFAVEHLRGIGFSRFKLINQVTFLELSERTPLIDRLALGAVRRLGYGDHRAIKRDGRWFTSGFSSGPAPWASSGQWKDADTVLRQFEAFHRTNRRNLWFDLHAC